MSDHIASINICFSGSTNYGDINNIIKRENFLVILIKFSPMQQIF